MMTAEHPNALRIHQFIEALFAGDLDKAMSMYADDAVYHVPGKNSISGSYRGRDEIRAFFIRLAELTQGTFRAGVDELLADDSHVFMFWWSSARRGDKTLDARGGMGFKVNPEGQFTESWFLYDDQAAYDDFYS